MPALGPDEGSVNVLASIVAKYSYSSPPTTSTHTPATEERRRSPRKRQRTLSSAELDLEDESEPRAPEKRPETGGSTLQSPRKPRRQGKRGYAPPETYAHLDGLTDCLRLELDVVFCGINPGRVSAQLGHHFANPNNHFYKALEISGFTSHRVSPSDDATLPERFNIGLTDLVDRPTSDESELSQAEKAASVPRLLTKIAHYWPHLVAFVGLAIARTVETEVHKLNCTGGNLAKNFKRDPGLQSFKLVYLTPANSQSVSETLFYAMPSSSGAVSQYQLKDKADIMSDVKAVLEQIKAGTLDTTNKMIVDTSRLPTFTPPSPKPSASTHIKSCFFA